MPNLQLVQASTTVSGSAAISTVQPGIVTDQIVTASIQGVTPGSYSWTLVPVLGSETALSSATAVAPTFTADLPGIYFLSLNDTYTMPFVVATVVPNEYVGPVALPNITPGQAPVPASGSSLSSDSTKIASILVTDSAGRKVPLAIVRSGNTASRPTSPSTGLYVGFTYFDTTLAAGAGKAIWWNGTNWVDATGATV